MYCNYCGLQNPENGRYCNQCGQPLAPGSSGNAVPPSPVSSSSVVPPPPISSAVLPPLGTIQQNDGKAVASLILGILALTMFWILTGIPAIILGHMSRSRIKKSMGRLKGDGMALAGLIMGYISLAILPFVLLIVAAIAVPNLLRARIAANEASAIGSLRTIDTANIEYSQKYGGFASNLSSLGGTDCAHADKDHACLIDPTLAGGQRSGYRFTYSAEDSDNDGVVDKFLVEAEPIAKNSSGRRTYCSDGTGVVRNETDGSRCTAESPMITGERDD